MVRQIQNRLSKTVDPQRVDPQRVDPQRVDPQREKEEREGRERRKREKEEGQVTLKGSGVPAVAPQSVLRIPKSCLGSFAVRV